MDNRIKELRAAKGWSQGELAARLGVSRQTVHSIEAGKADPSLLVALRLAWLFDTTVESVFVADLDDKMAVVVGTWQYQDRLATALDEVEVLDGMGREGWELIGFGPLVLRFRRPDDDRHRARWSYRRLAEVLRGERRDELERDGWTYCGSWMGTLHYFKRRA